jgi:RsiW-degrading membrane proteinase PrsW (M82 family)
VEPNVQMALFGAVPAILAMVYVDRLDAKRPEPRSTLRRVALAGGLSVIPVIIIELILQAVGPTDGYAAGLYQAFVVAAAPEEAAKVACVWLFVWKRPEFDERMDGIVYGARAGLGFALVENVGYLLGAEGGLAGYFAMFVGRAVLAVPGHAIWAGIMGYFAAIKRFDGRGPGLVGGYLIAFAMHGAYDAALFCAPVAGEAGLTGVSIGLMAIPVLVIICGAIVVRQMVRWAIAEDDRAEAEGRLVAYVPPENQPPPGPPQQQGHLQQQGYPQPPGYPPKKE